jgi:tetratricopeptide (TPR) repeat protein
MITSWRTSRVLAGIAAAGALLCGAEGRLEARQQRPDPAVLQQGAKDGERALAEGRYADAEKAYETLRQLSPGTAEVHARLGLIYFQQGKFTEAIAPLREAIRLKPALPKVEALLAMSLSELGQYTEALPPITKAFAQTADPVLRRMAGLHLQRIYTGLGRDQEAVDVALQLSRLYPDDPEVLYHSGRLFANFAYVQTMKLAAVAPDSVWLHQAAGEANETQGLYDAALREYRLVLAAAPRRPGIHFRIGRVLLERSKNEPAGSDANNALDARKAFEEELTLDPSNANAAYELGEMHRQAGELEPARALFEQAVSHYPAFEHALVGLGRTLIALGRPADALPRLTAALKGNPDNEVTYYQLAQAYRALGNTAEQEKALGEFNRVRSRAAARTAAVPQVKHDVTPQALDVKPPTPPK